MGSCVQLELFSDIAQAYAGHEELDNRELYRRVGREVRINDADPSYIRPVGRQGNRRNVFHRKVRWYQQTLKQLGVLERVPGKRGVWRLTREGRKKVELTRINPGFTIIAFSTRLGVALWADSAQGLDNLDEPISLCLTSPPYPLQESRAYGNPAEQEYVDWLCEVLEPIVKNLKPGGSIVLNLSNDIFLPRQPARSLYRERLVLALHDRLGLYKMDEIPWVNLSKPPGPVAWASKQRYQLNVGWEPIYWLTNDPARVQSDNRRVLQPHTERHQKLMAQGGTRRTTSYGDGAYTLRPGKYGTTTPGRIPKNVFQRGHKCAAHARYRAACQQLGLPVHGAAFPLALAQFFVRFLTYSEDDLVIEPFCGSGKTPLAAELEGVRWLAADVMREYLRGSAEMFKDRPGFQLHPALEDM